MKTWNYFLCLYRIWTGGETRDRVVVLFVLFLCFVSLSSLPFYFIVFSGFFDNLTCGSSVIKFMGSACREDVTGERWKFDQEPIDEAKLLGLSIDAHFS